MHGLDARRKKQHPVSVSLSKVAAAPGLQLVAVMWARSQDAAGLPTLPKKSETQSPRMRERRQQRCTCPSGWPAPSPQQPLFPGGTAAAFLGMSSVLAPLGCWKEATMRVQGPHQRVLQLAPISKLGCSFSLFLPTRGNGHSADL